MAMTRFICCISILTVAGALAAEPVAELLTVRGSTIYPTNVAAEVSAVAQAVAQAEAAAAQAEAVEAAAAMVSNAVAGVTEIVNSLEGIGYIRGHVMQFGAGIEANTNATASIVKLAPAGSTATNSLWDICCISPRIQARSPSSASPTRWAAPTPGTRPPPSATPCSTRCSSDRPSMRPTATASQCPPSTAAPSSAPSWT